ncbi:MAG: hypothetical protein EA400_05500 [Chromatiaceae bacterium]|nr:MAG: hypothetical protein EA400_05500 [Chromatiaceae bacterium]
MINRDEYLQKVKNHIDQWNQDLKQLEAKAEAAQADAAAEYRKQLEYLREMRDDAAKRHAQMQEAAGDAWKEVVHSIDKTWDAWVDAFGQMRDKLKG